jgi:hypothetical protein
MCFLCKTAWISHGVVEMRIIVNAQDKKRNVLSITYNSE